MKKNVLITGANGMLSKSLSSQLNEEYTVRFLTRKVSHRNEYLWDLKKGYIDPKALVDVDTVIHLAGAPIADRRWSDERKQLIVSSRVDTAKLILSTLKKNNLKINAFISASAIGYYGTTTTENIYNENSDNGTDFLSDVCHKWESAAREFTTAQVTDRVAILRIGIIFSNTGGALTKIVKPIRYGIGSALGSGNQYMPWIHIKDLSNMFKFTMENNTVQGIYNAVAPQHVTNRELTRRVGAILRRPLILPRVPTFIIKILFGELGDMILYGSRVNSDKMSSTGFQFEYGDLDVALRDLLDPR